MDFYPKLIYSCHQERAEEEQAGLEHQPQSAPKPLWERVVEVEVHQPPADIKLDFMEVISQEVVTQEVVTQEVVTQEVVTQDVIQVEEGELGDQERTVKPHTNRKCEFCKKDFGSKQSLWLHKKKEHKKGIDYLAAELEKSKKRALPIMSVHDAKRSKRGLFCKPCNFEAFDQFSLTTHKTTTAHKTTEILQNTVMLGTLGTETTLHVDNQEALLVDKVPSMKKRQGKVEVGDEMALVEVDIGEDSKLICVPDIDYDDLFTLNENSPALRDYKAKGSGAKKRKSRSKPTSPIQVIDQSIEGSSSKSKTILDEKTQNERQRILEECIYFGEHPREIKVFHEKMGEVRVTGHQLFFLLLLSFSISNRHSLLFLLFSSYSFPPFPPFPSPSSGDLPPGWGTVEHILESGRKIITFVSPDKVSSSL